MINKAHPPPPSTISAAVAIESQWWKKKVRLTSVSRKRARFSNQLLKKWREASDHPLLRDLLITWMHEKKLAKSFSVLNSVDFAFIETSVTLFGRVAVQKAPLTGCLLEKSVQKGNTLQLHYNKQNLSEWFGMTIKNSPLTGMWLEKLPWST